MADILNDLDKLGLHGTEPEACLLCACRVLIETADALAAAWLTYKDAQIAWDNLPKGSSPVEIRIETATRLTWATERMDAAHDAFLAARRSP